MADYKELFYQSQAKIADVVEELDRLSDMLKKHMIDMEEITVDENDKNNLIIGTKNKLRP